MNDELRKMAEEAGLAFPLNEGHSVIPFGTPTWEIIEAFARLVAEDCARIASPDYDPDRQWAQASRIAQAIRSKYAKT